MKNQDVKTPREYKIKRKIDTLKCAYCPPHKGENSSRKAKHGPQKPKYKDKRK